MKFEISLSKEMDEVTELAENNAALEAEETNGAEAAETAAAQDDTTQAQDAAPVTENAEGEVAASEGESTPESSATDAPEAGEPEASEPEANLPARDADGFSVSATDEDIQRKHIVGGVGYEVIYVVRTGDQQLVDESSQRVRTLIEETCEGAVDNVRASEVRRFAYPIKKQTEGVYVVVNARFKPEHTGELDRFFKLDENVLRHMLLKEEN